MLPFIINYFLGKFCFLLLPLLPLPRPPIHNFSNSPSLSRINYGNQHANAARALEALNQKSVEICIICICLIIVHCEKVLNRSFGLNSMDQSENLFLNNLRERKRKRSDISQALGTVKSTSLSDLEDMRNTLTKGDLLSLFKFKVPNALNLANFIWEIPTGPPKPTKKVLLANYCSKFSEIRGEFEVERCVRLLHFLTEGLETLPCEQSPSIFLDKSWRGRNLC